jgi:hypothetical protein
VTVGWLLRRPRVRQVDDTTWRLYDAVAYLGRHGDYFVPPGYLTDFASVPRLLWPVVPPYGTYTDAAIVHDWLITDGLGKGAVDITPAEVDAEFRRAMGALGVGAVRRWVMWAGVRWAAALNPIRRAGWLATLPLLLAVSAAALAPLAAVACLVLA